MKYTVISGRSGSGKTKKMLELLNKKEDNLVVTADPAVVYIEMQMAKNKEKGKCVGIESLAKTLAFDCNLKNMQEASKELQMVILSAIVLENNAFSQNRMDSSAVNRIYSFIHELDEQNISPSDFAAIEDKMPPFMQDKTKAVASVYKKFMDTVHKQGYYTKEDILRYVCENLPQELPYRHIFIDVLDRYNPNTILLFQKLLMACSSMVIVFNTTSPKALDFEIHQEGMSAMLKMYDFVDTLKDCTCERIENKSIRNKNNAISIIEKELFNRDTVTKSEAENISLHNASTMYKEVDYVSAQIKKLVKEGVKYSDIIISSTSIDRYIPIIESSFRNNGIPFYYYKNNSLDKSMLYSFFDTVMDIVFNGLEVDNFLSLCFLNFHKFTQEELSVADNFFKRFGNNMSIAMENGKRFDPFDYIVVLKMIKRVVSNILVIDDSGKNVAKFISSLYTYAEKTGVKEILAERAMEAQKEGYIHAAKELAGTWNDMISIFNTIVDTIGEEAVPVSTLREIIRRMVSEKISHNTNLYHGQVAVLDMDNAQNRKSKYLFAIGCNDGYMPKMPTTPLFSDREKNILNEHFDGKLKPLSALEAYSRTAVFKTLTLPQDKLYITWADNDMDFTPLHYAAIIGNIVKAFSNVDKEKEFYTEDKEESFLHLLKSIARQKYEGKAYVDENEFACFANDPQYGKRLEEAVKKLSLGSEKKFYLKNPVKAYPNTGSFGVTRLEMFHACPMKHFIRHALMPRGKKLFEESASDKGSYYHVVYNLFFEKCRLEKIDLHSLNENNFENMLSEVFTQADAEHNENILNTTAKYRYMAEKMKARVRASLWQAVQQIVGGSFEIYANEYGVGKNIPLDVTIDGRVYHIVGTIDRVDVCGNNCRIIDYKSGNIDFDRSKLEQGIQLQLPLYSKAMEEEEMNVTGIYYFRIKDMIRDADAITSKLRAYRLQGITLSDMDAIMQNDNNIKLASEIIPVEITAKGDISKRSKTVSKEGLEEIVDIAKTKAEEAIAGIVSGETKAYPLQTKDYNACEYCPYKAICNINSKNYEEIRRG